MKISSGRLDGKHVSSTMTFYLTMHISGVNVFQRKIYIFQIKINMLAQRVTHLNNLPCFLEPLRYSFQLHDQIKIFLEKNLEVIYAQSKHIQLPT
jgi:hypothetical protein